MSRLSRRSSVRVRQFLLTAAMVTPLVVAIANTPPFVAAPRARAGANMIGPLAPIMAGSESVVPQRSGNVVAYPTTWACGDNVSNRLTLSNPDGTGKFRTISRELGSLHQEFTATAFVNGAPQRFSMTETRGSTVVHSTDIELIDANSDGVFESARFTGQYNATISLVYSGDSVSIPWSEASTLGIDTTYSCGGPLPQIWVPLADTNNDGRGDSVVFDLDGNGTPDGDVYTSPVIALAPVPTMGPVARFVLIMLIGLTASWFLSRRRHDAATGTPA